jgi:hypothetical protein
MADQSRYGRRRRRIPEYPCFYDAAVLCRNDYDNHHFSSPLFQFYIRTKTSRRRRMLLMDRWITDS